MLIPRLIKSLEQEQNRRLTAINQRNWVGRRSYGLMEYQLIEARGNT